MCPAAEDNVGEPGKLWLWHIPFVLLLWQTAFPEREHEGWWEDSRAAQSDEHTHRELVKEAHFACLSEEVRCAPGKQIFGWKLLNFSSDAQKWALCIMATPGNSPWGSLDSCWLQQMERVFFLFPCHVSQVFPKSGFSEDAWHTLLVSWMDFWGGRGHDLPHIPARCTLSVLAVVGSRSCLGTAEEPSATAEGCWLIIPVHIHTWDVLSFPRRMP